VFISHIESLESRRLLATASGTIYDDVNHNGILDSPDLGIAGRTAYLDLNSNNSFDVGEPSATSGTGGRFYVTTDGAPDSALRQVLPSGWTASGPTSYSVLGGQFSSNKNFGAYPTGSTVPTGSITVSAFNDANGNGIRDAGETPSSGQNIFLDYDDDGYTYNQDRELTTDAQGNVQFTSVRPGTYVVRMAHNLQSGTQSAPSDDGPLIVTVNTGPANAGSFGFAANSYFSRISGFVFEDKNQNGTQESGETSLSPGHTVYIDSNNNAIMDSTERRMTTQLDGYWFYSVRPGTYTLRVIPADGWYQTSPANNAARVVTTQAGVNPPLQYFGAAPEIPPAVVSTNLFFDRSAPPFMEITFSEDIDKTVFAAQPRLHNLTTGQDFPTSLFYNPANHKLTIPLRQTILTDGNYNLTLQAGDVKDLRGNTMAAAYSYNFFILKGDLNRDRSVTINDFITLAANFNKPGLPSTGDLNDDGSVTISDYIDLSSNFGKILSPPDPAPAPMAMAAESIVLAKTFQLTTKAKARHHHRPANHVGDLLG
jgi:hypothetical protein